MKKFTIGLIVLMSVCMMLACSSEKKDISVLTESPFHATFAAAQAEAQKSGKDILIDFYTDT